MINNILQSTALAATLAVLGLVSTSTSAQALVLTSKLLGDPRLANPDGLIADVLIETGADAGLADNQARWTVTLNSLLHPDVKLDAFYFNLANSIKNQVSFSVLGPTGWAVGALGSGTNAAGSGGADFQFEVDKSKGNAPDVTSAGNLTFQMTSAAGSLTLTDFLAAPSSSGADGILVGQLGAHLQSLNAGSGQSDSGFATGIYTPTAVPTPALLPGLIAMGVGVLRKRKAEQIVEETAEV